MRHALSTGLHEPVLQTHQRPARVPLRQTDSAPREWEPLRIGHAQPQLTTGLGHRLLPRAAAHGLTRCPRAVIRSPADTRDASTAA